MEKKNATQNLTRGGLLLAILLLLAITPLGYLTTGGLEITFLMIPVVIGAVIIGPLWGAILGLIFGVTSFIRSFQTPFGIAVLSISTPATFFTCVVPRILMGWLTGLLYRQLSRRAQGMLPIVAASLAGPLLNTILFMSSLILLFGQSEFVKSLQGDTPLIPFVVAFVGINGLVEALASFVLCTAICRALLRRKE